jgi:hypothetical protein
LTAQTGQTASAQACFTDELGRVYFQTDLGFGLLHTLDVAIAADGLALGVWSLEELESASMSTRFGYLVSPAQGPKKPL